MKHKKDPREISRGSQTAKSLAEFDALAANKDKNIFGRGMYVDKNTSQAASVEFICWKQINYARSRLQNWRKSPKGFFDKLRSTGNFPWI